jgi:type II secretory ATPase GspE/PulE/Tfp pilus assembly ATPase PilB-like protein
MDLMAVNAATIRHPTLRRALSMLDDGWRKCATGITSIEEVLRVARKD